MIDTAAYNSDLQYGGQGFQLWEFRFHPSFDLGAFCDLFIHASQSCSNVSSVCRKMV
jgi:hypothetical protein